MKFDVDTLVYVKRLLLSIVILEHIVLCLVSLLLRLCLSTHNRPMHTFTVVENFLLGTIIIIIIYLALAVCAARMSR